MTRKAIKYGAAAALVAVVVIALALRSGPTRVDVELTPAAVIEPQLSRIATPVTIPLAELRRLADQQLSGEIYSEDREIAAGIRVAIAVLRRSEPIEMRMDEGWLVTRVPVTAVGTPEVRLGPLRLPPGAAGGLEADLDVTMRTRVRLNPDWSVSSETTAEVAVERADLTLAGRVTDATEIVSDIVNRNADRLTAPLEEYLDALDVRSALQPIWERFREPVQLTQAPPAWLRVRPVKFSVSPPDGEADSVRFDIGMEAYLDSIVGERPAPLELGPIPDLVEASAELGSFNVVIPIAFELAEAGRILAQRITGREDRIGEDTVVRWRRAELSGSGDRLKVAVEFEADTGFPLIRELTGIMTLEGRPSYDRASQTLTMENIDYELEADRMLATLADWLLHDRLRERIQSQLVFPMEDLIQDLRRTLETEMGSISFGGYGTAQAGIDRLEPSLRAVSGKWIDLAVVADGTLRLELSLAP